MAAASCTKNSKAAKANNDSKKTTIPDAALKARQKVYFDKAHVPPHELLPVMTDIMYLMDEWKLDVTRPEGVFSLFVTHKTEIVSWKIIRCITEMYRYTDKTKIESIHTAFSIFFEKKYPMTRRDVSNKLTFSDAETVKVNFFAGKMDVEISTYPQRLRRNLPETAHGRNTVQNQRLQADTTIHYGGQDLPSNTSSTPKNSKKQPVAAKSVPKTGKTSKTCKDTQVIPKKRASPTAKSSPKMNTADQSGKHAETNSTTGQRTSIAYPVSDTSSSSAPLIDGSRKRSYQETISQQIANEHPEIKREGHEAHPDAHIDDLYALEASFAVARAQLEQQRIQESNRIKRIRRSLDQEVLDLEAWYNREVQNLATEEDVKRNELVSRDNTHAAK